MFDIRNLIPGLDSYRGRYAYLSALAGIVLLTIALIGWGHVSRTSQSQIESISRRAHTTGLLVEIQADLNQLENRLQRIVISPDAADIDAVNALLAALGRRLNALDDVLLQVSADQSDQSSALIRDSRQLDTEVARLIAVRKEVDQWFPAMRLLQERMAPHNQAFLGELQEMLQESESQPSTEARLAMVEGVTSLRRLWLAMEEEMHHFVAYRFGVFSSGPEGEMPDFQGNVRGMSARVDARILALNRLFVDDASDPLGEAHIDALRMHHQAWIAGSRQVFGVMGKDTWRRDLQMMRETIAPILSHMRGLFSQIDLRLDNDAAADITQLTGTARQLSDSILGIALIGMLMILAAYLYIKRNLLQPIAQTAFALKEEARGALDVKPPPVDLRETRDLVEAFNEMRRQVHQRQRYLDHIAHHDALTQLPNRILFRDRLEHALAIALRGETQIGLMFLDLDQFKQINDSLGHLVGDELLKVVAERLTSLVRNSDTVARLGGDEFAILVEGVGSREDMSMLARKILQAVEKPMTLQGNELRISVSIGIATAPYDDVTAEYLIRDADAAMYEAKRQGRAAFRFFSGELTTRAAEIMQL
ncbi:MAG: diguanylate cyclase [Candidatus Thiodiazotropha sp.]